MKSKVLGGKHCFLSVSKTLSCNSQDSSVACKEWSEVEFGAWRHLLGRVSWRFDNVTRHHIATDASCCLRVQDRSNERCSVLFRCVQFARVLLHDSLSVSDIVYCRIVLACVWNDFE